MADADESMADHESPQQPLQSIETDQAEDTVKQEDEAGDGSDHDNTGDIDETAAEVSDGKISNTLYKTFKAITETLLNFKTKLKSGEEHFPSGLFKRLPNKRLLPEYYDIIREPSAISTLRGKIQRKQYSGVPEFVRDFALVVHNAQIFNRPNSQPVRDVLKLDEIFKEELQKLVSDGLATADEVKYPDLGEIPYATPEPDPVSEDEEGEEEGEEEDEEEEADDSDEDKKRKRGGRRGKNVAGKRGDDEDDDDKAGDADQKRRGRPPKVATPMEHRIDRILKALKKPRSKTGVPMITPFERLPDKIEHPEYYTVITQPIAYDMLKKKAKRKKYSSIDELMKDIELMFTNAKRFNEDGSDIYNWADELLVEARRAETEERARPDEDFLAAADGRIPLPYITYKGDMWKVGDWIHIQNPNDVTKPIIAQIYRTWKTADAEEWINACWYYRPEQTVHQYEKHFFPNEVVKTGQYRDHKIEEVVNKCFVMFYTRYSRGRPRDLPTNAEVYVCEARYNEDKHKFNKIKTWASCLPDEVRDKDYEMDLFDQPRKIKKVPSPLLSRVDENMKETDELPKPEFKHPGAPPIIGGIHKRPRDENQSPPPEPTPPPPPAPPPVLRTPSVSMQNSISQPTPSLERRPSSNLGSLTTTAKPTPSMTPQPSFNVATPGPSHYSRQPGYNTTFSQTSGVTAQLPPQQQAPYQQTQFQPSSLGAAHPGSYSGGPPAQNYARPGAPHQPPPHISAHAAAGITQRIAETYVLSDAANESIPKNIRDQFPCDDQGRVLFFTQPPLEDHHSARGLATTQQDSPLAHTKSFLESVSTRKRKAAEMDQTIENLPQVNGKSQISSAAANNVQDSQNMDALGSSKDSMLSKDVGDKLSEPATEEIRSNMIDRYKVTEGDDWATLLQHDLAKSQSTRTAAVDRDKLAEIKRMTFNTAHLNAKGGELTLNKQGYLDNWQKDFFRSTYLDDHDSRLPF